MLNVEETEGIFPLCSKIGILIFGSVGFVKSREFYIR